MEKNMHKVPIILKRSIKSYLSSMFWIYIGKIINRSIVAYNVYKNKNSNKYNLIHSRLPVELIKEKNKYVDIGGLEYKNVHITNDDTKNSSQYYLYKNIIGSSKANICNIGAYYCGADFEFLNSNKDAKVYALDFGDMDKLNKEINHNRLFLYSGYPLESLENILGQKGEYFFDYIIFTRTAVLMNKNELNEYMKVIRKISKKIAFLEVVDISTINRRILNYDSISLDEPIKMYGGMYIHNYIKLIEHFGFECTDSYILPPGSFPNESANGHYMICVAGRFIKY